MSNTEATSQPISRRVQYRALPMLALLAVALAGCGASQAPKGSAPSAGGKGAPPPQVAFVIAQSSRSALYADLPGRTNAFRSAEIRPQVTGVVRRLRFVEGSLVRAGQTLYEIEPRLYEASAAQARANVASARATAGAAKTRVERYRPLAAMNAVSQQELTDAEAQSSQASAAVAQAEATLQTARINLGYTRVPSPISGRIGRSLVTEGALVTANQTAPLAVVTQLDPIYVDVQQSSADLLALRRATASNSATASADVTLTLEDGSFYDANGTVQFSEVVVDASTGSVTLRARFANPRGLLLPGMFVRARFIQSVDPTAILVPQQAVTRSPRGEATVAIIGPNNIVEIRTVTAARAQGADWVVTAGLKPGERIITEGVEKVRPNGPVRAVPMGSAETTAGGLALRGGRN